MEKFQNKPGIYKITNNINKKTYIGLSKNVKQRINSHIGNSDKQDQIKNKNLYWAFNEFGIDHFIFEMVEYCKVSELAYKEIYYIKKYNSYLKGYNSSTGGEGTKEQDFYLFLPKIPKVDDSYLDMFILWSENKQTYFKGFSESDTPKWSKNIKNALIYEKPEKFIDESSILVYISRNLELKIKNLEISEPFCDLDINERFSFSTFRLEKKMNGEIYYFGDYTNDGWSKMNSRSMLFNDRFFIKKKVIEIIFKDPEINITIKRTVHNKLFKSIFYFFSVAIIPIISFSTIELGFPIIIPILLLIYSVIFIMMWIFIPYKKSV